MHRYSRLLKILKIAVGSMLAMAAAQALGLRYSSSAGVITLLSIQDTKREPYGLQAGGFWLSWRQWSWGRYPLHWQGTGLWQWGFFF